MYGQAFWDYDWVHKKSRPRVPTTVNILCLSKVIHEEALQILCTSCVFRLAIQYSRFDKIKDPSPASEDEALPVLKGTIPQPLNVFDLAENIMNVDLMFCVASWAKSQLLDYPFGKDLIERMCQSSVNLFTGIEPARKLFRVTFCSTKGVSGEHVLYNPFFDALKKMHGFRRLILQVDSPYYDKDSVLDFLQEANPMASYFPDHLESQDFEHWLDDAGYSPRENHEGESFLKPIREELEQALGPCIEDDVQGADSEMVSHFLEFRPSSYYAKRLPAGNVALSPPHDFRRSEHYARLMRLQDKVAGLLPH